MSRTSRGSAGSSGDPCWGKKNDGLDVEKFTGGAKDYKISQINIMKEYKGWGGNGPKPSGIISIKGVLYLSIQNFLGDKPAVYGSLCQHGSDTVIIKSKDYGKTWFPKYKDVKVMFPGWKFGGAAFINFGRDNANARDEYVYAVSGDQWDNGSDLRIGRVHQDKIMERDAWEFAAEVSEHGVRWDKELEKAVSILHLDRKLSIPDMVYVKALNRYILSTWSMHKDFDPHFGTALYMFESENPWGPFELFHYQKMWEDNLYDCKATPYCPRIPLKWMAKDGKSGWLQFSGHWWNPDQYRSHVRPFKLTLNK